MFCLETISADIAQHFARTTFAELPATTVHATRRALLDAVGVMLAATGLAEDVAPYQAHAAETPGPCRLLGSGARTSPAMAALANGSLAHALDFGDTFDAGPAHPNAATVPALLALADADPAITTGELLTAMALGADLACRLSIAAPRPYEAGGWYPPPLVNTIAAAAACAKLLGLTADGIRDAMGLALLQASFPAEIKLDPTSPLRGVREGFAARAAVEAALLARAGARAFAQPLEGAGGFFAVYAGGPPTPALWDGMGETWLGERVSFKPWPACRGTHPYIEAALALRDRVDPAAITSIEAETGPIQAMLIRPGKARPQSAIDARFSIPYTVARALIDGQVDLDSFTPARRQEAQVLALTDRVIERANPAWTRAEAASGSLTIVLNDGTRHHHAVTTPMGSPERPIDDAALTAKFVACASHAARAIDGDVAEALAGRLLGGDPAVPAASLLSLD
ncbi:MmgE/PrpD family protein [Sphingomonas sp. Y38-1Y]|uniref:MmgE/PrpD family protein n=1 Tax=Sphingomonas sp. Y38-1Y TaxID=3078265 RepID=UPI0028E925E0|nr:MmgE/PrpD family protein [Sphingomonas sp. Y38-1Y]